MKRLAVLAFLSAVCIVQAGKVTLKVSGSSGLKGTAIVLNELKQDGSKRARMEMSLRDKDGNSVIIEQESVYDSSAKPVYKRQTTSINGSEQQSLTATFEGAVVLLISKSGGKSTQSTVVVPQGKPIAEKFEFWFLRDKIGLNGENTFFRFDMVSRSFERTHAIYRGIVRFKIGRRTVRARFVEVDDSKFYLDDRGDPYKIVTAGVVMERV